VGGWRENVSKALIKAGWGHVPHISEATKTELLSAYPEHERKARTEGEPVLGSGLVLPVDPGLFTCEPFAIPRSWPRIVGLDFGWDHPAAAAWLAWDRDADCVYVTDCWAMRESTPAQQAPMIIGKGRWIPVAWPHDGLQHDKGSGEQLAQQYRNAAVNMLPERATWPDGTHGVEAGITDIIDRMRGGRWRVFSTCGSWLAEQKSYHRKDGLIVKKKDDVISASRYALMSLRFARLAPSATADTPARSFGRSGY
jgi:hypothetical protein